MTKAEIEKRIEELENAIRVINTIPFLHNEAWDSVRNHMARFDMRILIESELTLLRQQLAELTEGESK